MKVDMDLHGTGNFLNSIIQDLETSDGNSIKNPNVETVSPFQGLGNRFLKKVTQTVYKFPFRYILTLIALRTFSKTLSKIQRCFIRKKNIKNSKIEVDFPFYILASRFCKRGNQGVYIGLYLNIDFHGTDNLLNNTF